jgi:hypothetical protein
VAALLLTFGASEAWAFNCPGPIPAGEAAPCYVAFVHGSGINDLGATDTGTTWDSHGPGTAESNWWSDAHPDSVEHSFTYAGSGQHLGAAAACQIVRIRYDGMHAFFNGAHQVASDFNDWFCSSQKPNKVVVVTHSMGGLVMRWILNHAANPQSGYYSPLWAEIAARISYVITVQAPHTGSPAAAALWGSSPSDYQNAVGDVANFFGIRTRDEGYCDASNNTNCASWYMQPTVLEEASSPSGWMGDALRAQTLFTIGSDSVGFDSGPETRTDLALAAVWTLLFGDTDGGDGLVDRPSAHGFNPSTGNWIAGPLTTWIDMKANHHQARYNDYYMHETVYDRITETRHSNYPGSYIGEFGMNLPWSTIYQDYSRQAP